MINHISFQKKEDIVCHIQYKPQLNDENSIKKFRQNINYNGLGDEVEINKALNNEDYMKVLNHLWSETDKFKRLKWLNENANPELNLYPILLFELAEELIIDSPTLETYFNKCLPYLNSAGKRVQLDAFCTSDNSVGAGAGMLIYLYLPRIKSHIEKKYSSDQITNYLQNESQKKEYDSNMASVLKNIMTSIVNSEKLSKTLPSPKWIFAHGMSAYIGNQNSIKEDQFDSIRKAKAQELLDHIINK
jgi:hypothetical protein